MRGIFLLLSAVFICSVGMAQYGGVQEECNINFPTAFSPNGDGVNDCWQPESNCQIDSLDVTIYNRWGSVIFQFEDATDCWMGQGQDRKKTLPTGTYYYVAKIRLSGQESQQITGVVTLIL